MNWKKKIQYRLGLVVFLKEELLRRTTVLDLRQTNSPVGLVLHWEREEHSHFVKLTGLQYFLDFRETVTLARKPCAILIA